MGRCPKPCLEPSFGEGSKDSQNSPEKGVPPSESISNFVQPREGGTPFSGKFLEFLKPSPKEGFKRGLGRSPKVFPPTSAIVDVIDDDGAFGGGGEVWGGEDDAVAGEELPGAELIDRTAEDDLGGSEDDELTVTDIDAAAATDDLIHAVALFGDVADGMSGDGFCHFAAVFEAVGVLLTPEDPGKELLAHCRVLP